MTRRFNHRGWIVLQSIECDDATHSVDFFENAEARFGFELLRSDPEDAGRWTSLSLYSSSTFATLAEACAEAARSVRWLDQQPRAKSTFDAWRSTVTVSSDEPATGRRPSGSNWQSVDALGIDVGSDRLHVVGLDHELRVITTRAYDPADLGAVTELMVAVGSGARSIPIAIDAPDGPSAAPFRDDPNVSAKFRSARGCEVELGRQHKIWVSFVTPCDPSAMAPWMRVGADLHALAREHGHQPLECFPHAVHRLIAGTRLPRKTSGLGAAARAANLRRIGIGADHLEMWGHDALDAVAIALVGIDHARGASVAVHCEADGTTIWLPAPRPQHGS